MQDKETLFVSEEIEDIIDLDYNSKVNKKSILSYFKFDDTLSYCTIKQLKIKNKNLQVRVNTSCDLIEKLLLKSKVFFIVVSDNIEIINKEISLDANLKINRKKNHSYNMTIKIKDFKDGI